MRYPIVASETVGAVKCLECDRLSRLPLIRKPTWDRHQDSGCLESRRSVHALTRFEANSSQTPGITRRPF